MKISSFFRMLVAACAFVTVAQASATPTLLIDSNGILDGANNVNVSGTLYDVRFVAGSCNSVFNGCKQATFNFHTMATAVAAAQALLDQVFVDGPNGQFDSVPKQTFGCAAKSCTSIIPYAPYNVVSIRAALAHNDSVEASDNAEYQFMSKTSDTSYALYGAIPMYNYALFTLAANDSTVPEPSSIALMGVAMAGLAFARRRKA